jgi:pilus assembly protein CpaE
VGTDVLEEALRSGMREVVALSHLDALAPAAHRARTLHDAIAPTLTSAAAEPEGKVVTVFSAKGGVGKTTMATNLAVALTRGGADEVCLVDLDLSFGDVSIALQIFPQLTIADTVAMQAHLDLEGLESVLTACGDGLFALAAPVTPDAKDSITPRLVSDILGLLRQRFSFVVIDTAPAFDDQVLQAFDDSDLIVLVATPDIPALKNLKVACETINLLNIPKEQLLVVVNRADSMVGISPEEIATSLGMAIASSVPSSRDVPTSVNRGELIFVASPRHPVSQGVAHLAEQVRRALTDPLSNSGATSAVSAAAAAQHKSSRRSGLFSRRGAR